MNVASSTGRGIEALVDVLMPAYNAEETIGDAVRSMQRQGLDRIRVVVVDDGSTDGTGAILERLAGEDGRVTIISTVNRGIVDALNEGLRACTARYIARHDADDLAFPDRLSKQVAYLDAHPDVIAVSGNAWHINAEGRRLGHVTDFSGDVSGDPSFAPSIEPYLMHPFLMIRRSALLAAGGYRYVFHAEDTDLYWRLLDQGRLHNLPDVLGEYRVHAGSISSQSIVNGRIAAINSQLASVSEMRRRAGKKDLAFPKSRLNELKTAGTLANMLEHVSRELDPSERRYLAIATSAKLLELSSYRPYRLERDDLVVIRSSLANHLSILTAFNRRQIVFRQVLLRRLGMKRYREIVQMMPLSVLPRACLEVGLYVLRKRFGRVP